MIAIRIRKAFVIAPLALCSVAGAQERPSTRPYRPSSSHAKALVPAGYPQIVRAWHTPTRGQKVAVDVTGRPELVLHAMYVQETVALRAATVSGGFVGSDLDLAAHALRDPQTGNEHPIEPRTLELLYRIQLHFHAAEIRVMSAYRTPNEQTTQGLHGRGRAIDFVVPGTTDEDVARFARELGFVGVGLYPAGSFIHVDVRARSYFWVDRSGPGHRSRERGMLGELAARSDAEALARGEKPPSAADSRNGANDSSTVAEPNEEDEE